MINIIIKIYKKLLYYYSSNILYNPIYLQIIRYLYMIIIIGIIYINNYVQDINLYL